MVSIMDLKKNQIKLRDYDPDKNYPEGTEFVLDDSIDLSKYKIPKSLKKADKKLIRIKEK